MPLTSSPVTPGPPLVTSQAGVLSVVGRRSSVSGSGTDTVVPAVGRGAFVPKPPLPEAVAAQLAEPWHATISTVRPDGQPVSVPTWYLYEDGRILVNMDAGRKRLEHLRRNPRVSLSAIDAHDWFTHISILGRATELADDVDLRDIDRIARHYTGKPYAVRDRPRVNAWIAIDRWHGWGRTKAAR